MSIDEQEFSDRKELINSRDGLAYAIACAEEGIEPEVPDLAERGMADQFYEQRRLAALQNSIGHANHIRFVLAAKKLDVENKWNDTAAKQYLLQKHFPKKFGYHCPQDISGYSAPRIGDLFMNVLKYYNTKLSKSK